MSIQTVRVLIVEDHVVVREGTRELIQRDPAVEVVGEAGSAKEALTLTDQLRPDVVLLDLSLPDRNGIDVLPALCESAPDARIVVLSAYDDGDYVVAAIEAGASGYLLKTARGQEVVEAIHAVRKGQVVLQSEVAGKLRLSLRRGVVERQAALSPREMEILSLAAKGWRNRDIASEMGISVRTVEGHLSHILGKLGLSSRTEAVVYGAAHGWFELN